MLVDASSQRPKLQKKVHAAWVKANANVEDRKRTESWADYITAEDSPKLQLLGKNFPESDAAINQILKESENNITITEQPRPGDNLAFIRHLNLMVLMQKTIDINLLPFGFDAASAVTTYEALTKCFPKADTNANLFFRPLPYPFMMASNTLRTTRSCREIF